ncbi:MAG: hypothetical protein GF313_00620 [Caldithrix sp.]|nr:hypothetical protein [Caldithrix sp.]
MTKSLIFEIAEVDSYAGYRGEERPVAIYYQQEKWVIETIIDQWFEGPLTAGKPSYRYFKVRTIKDRIFILRYNTSLHIWSVLLK